MVIEQNMAVSVLSFLHIPPFNVIIYWFIQKNLICFYHLGCKPMYFCEINFVFPFHWRSKGNNLIRNRPIWTIYLTKFRKFYGWYMIAASKSNLVDPLSRFWSKHFSLPSLCKILWLIMWNNAYFPWRWSVIYLIRIQ